MKFARLILIVSLTALICSCSSKKSTLPYFADISFVEEGEIPELDHHTVIKTDDELSITITSSVPSATSPYNYVLSNVNNNSIAEAGSPIRQLTYLVDNKGNINMPIIGEMHVSGLTVEELQNKLVDIIRKDVPDANVKVELVNFHVYIAGEVMRPMRINVHSDRFSILDAITEAGDLSQYGRRNNILLIRNEDGKRIFKRLDLTSSEILTSPYFYLKQNDYIYVEPNEVLQSNARYNTNNAYKLQVAATIVSASSVLISLLIALVIK